MLKHMISGQAIPRGLHVRLNLETGERQAKLLDENERTDMTLVPDDVQGRHISQEELQAALKKLPGEESIATIEVLQNISLKMVYSISHNNSAI
jgi:nucleotide exchange factor SIL1